MLKLIIFVEWPFSRKTKKINGSDREKSADEPANSNISKNVRVAQGGTHSDF
jgi:hypothetical protein